MSLIHFDLILLYSSEIIKVSFISFINLGKFNFVIRFLNFCFFSIISSPDFELRGRNGLYKMLDCILCRLCDCFIRYLSLLFCFCMIFLNFDLNYINLSSDIYSNLKILQNSYSWLK